MHYIVICFIHTGMNEQSVNQSCDVIKCRHEENMPTLPRKVLDRPTWAWNPDTYIIHLHVCVCYTHICIYVIITQLLCRNIDSLHCIKKNSRFNHKALFFNPNPRIQRQDWIKYRTRWANPTPVGGIVTKLENRYYVLYLCCIHGYSIRSRLFSLMESELDVWSEYIESSESVLYVWYRLFSCLVDTWLNRMSRFTTSTREKS